MMALVMKILKTMKIVLLHSQNGQSGLVAISIQHVGKEGNQE